MVSTARRMRLVVLIDVRRRDQAAVLASGAQLVPEASVVVERARARQAHAHAVVRWIRAAAAEAEVVLLLLVPDVQPAGVALDVAHVDAVGGVGPKEVVRSRAAVEHGSYRVYRARHGVASAVRVRVVRIDPA